MELVVDASIIFTAMTGRGVTKDIIFLDAIKLYAPEYLSEELDEHKGRIAEISGLSDREVESLLSMLKARIRLVPRIELEGFLREANELVADKDDTEYIALSLARGHLPIWSNDNHFKQQGTVEVLTTAELVSRLKSAGVLS